ncbi:MAG: HAMP domain-containing histidine kinase [Spirochaetes bacterium]|nr:HAMP domain-containing histidine kinase [Spirochaetota bacterium]
MTKKNDTEKIFGPAIGRIIHDIRNSLNTIIGFSSILQIDETINDEIKSYLKKIFHSGMAIEQLLSNIDYYMIDKIDIDEVDFEVNAATENYVTTQIDIINDKQIEVEYLTEDRITLKFSLDIFNKILNNLFQFSLKGMKTLGQKYVQIFFKKENNNFIIVYSDASAPVFIENDYFNFEEIMKYRRGLGVMFIERYVKLYNGKIEYKYGKKWKSAVSNLTSKIKNNHGFIIQIPLSKN